MSGAHIVGVTILMLCFSTVYSKSTGNSGFLVEQMQNWRIGLEKLLYGDVNRE